MFFAGKYRISKLSFVAILTTMLFTPAHALDRVLLETPAMSGTAFEVVDGSDSETVSVAELEALGLYRVTTNSPWEEGELTFEGVLFRDVLKKLGLDDAEAVLVRALDNYTQIIPREDWMDGPLLLATRQDGNPLTRRTQGPTRLVYPLLDQPEYDTELHKPRWVWMIKSIERPQ